MYKIWNVTGFRVQGKHGGKIYEFMPYEEKDIWDPYAVVHLSESFDYLGLVPLVWDEKNQKKYKGDFEAYKSAKEIEGLKSLLAWKQECLNYEVQAAKECKKAGSELDLTTINMKKFEEEIKLIKEWLKAAGGTLTVRIEDKEDVVAKRPEWKNTKVVKGKGKNDSNTDVDQV